MVSLPNRIALKQNILFLVAAAILTGITVLLIGNLLRANAPKQQTGTAAATVPVVVSASYLVPGVVLEASDLKVIDWPSSAMPDEGEVFSNKQLLVGRTVRQEILPNEPIFRSRLAGERSRGGLPVVIPFGKRAVTVGVSEVRGVAGFIKPGDWVDVLVTVDQEVAQGRRIQMTRTVLQNVQVVAVAQDMLADPSESLRDKSSAQPAAGPDPAAKVKAAQKPDPKLSSSVTLVLTPEESESLTLADEIGSLRLALRPELDSGDVPLYGITSGTLMGTGDMLDAPAPSATAMPSYHRGPSAAPVRRGKAVEFYDGVQKTVYQF